MNFDTIKKAEVWQCEACKHIYHKYQDQCDICAMLEMSRELYNNMVTEPEEEIKCDKVEFVCSKLEDAYKEAQKDL